MRHNQLPRIAAVAAMLAAWNAASAQVPTIFKDADVAQGDKLMAEHKCDSCHAQKWTNDGKAIYRPGVTIKDAAQLRGKVDQCNVGVNANLFPEEVTDIAAALNRSHYHFRQ